MKHFTPKDAETLMKIIVNRRDVRGHHFSSAPINEQELQMLLEAAHHAPSVGYSQPWKFVVVKDETLQEAIYRNFKESFKKSKKKFKHRPEYAKLKLEALKETKLHIAVFYHHQGGYILGQTSQADVGRYSVATAIENMWLMARALNIGMGWVSILKPKKVRKLLGLGEAYEMVGYLCVGKLKSLPDEPELKILGWETQKERSRTVTVLDGTTPYGSTRHIRPICGTKAPLERLIDKKATFLIALSHTKTANIKGITQAGLPGLMHLTPTLDAEFVKLGRLKSLKKLPKTAKGIPTPALITRAVHLLTPYGHIEALDLGLKTPPKLKQKHLHRFGIVPSGNIAKDAKIDARELFEKGYHFGESYQLKDNYLILGESVPSGTTTATATALALGYEAEGLFSSSFKDVPNDIRQRTITKALKKAENKTDLFDILGTVSDNMLIFNAGFILGVNGRFPVVLAGGTQMAAVLLVANRIIDYMGTAFEVRNLALCTTKWVAKDKHSNIKALLQMLDFPINAYYTDFDFSCAHTPALKRYDKGEAKEGAGAGAAIMYGYLNGLGKEEISRQVEGFLG